MQWQQRIVFRPETAHYSSLVKNKQHCTSSAPGLPQIVDHCRCDWNRTIQCIQVSLLPARPRPINKDRFTRIFLSDAVTTEFPSPGDDRIQFHAVSLLEASIFTKAVSKQRVLATDAFRLLCFTPFHIIRKQSSKSKTASTHNIPKSASQVEYVVSAESNLVFGQIQKWCGGRNKGDLPDGKRVQKRKDGSSIIIC